MKKVILAGGGGTRLWPLSTEDMPKQFIPIFSSSSLLQDTVARLSQLEGGRDEIYFSTHQKYQDKIVQQIGCAKDKLILEPERKNTAPAIALVIKYLEDIVGCSQDELVLIAPADHIISPQESFAEYMYAGIEHAKQGKVVVFGITPTKPETGYGYIQCASADGGVVPVAAFMEKPDRQTAIQYLSSGKYLWNAGIFMFTLQTIKDAFAKHCPQVFQSMQLSYVDFVNNFASLESISFDYAVMEKIDNVVVCPMHLLRSDIGSRDAVDELLTQHVVPNQNPYLTLDEHNNLIYTQQKIFLDGIQDSFVVSGDAGLYIAKKGNSQSIKDFLAKGT